jgi:hypothetical protein
MSISNLPGRLSDEVNLQSVAKKAFAFLQVKRFAETDTLQALLSTATCH